MPFKALGDVELKVSIFPMWGKWLSVQFRNPRYPHIYLRYLIPGRIIHFSGLRESKDFLKYPDSFGQLPVHRYRQQ